MQKLGGALALTLAFLLFIPAAAPARDAFRNVRDKSSAAPPPKIHVPTVTNLTDDGIRRAATAATETTFLGFWDFDSGSGGCDPQGWVSADITAQTGDYIHVDDFAGLGGGISGLLAPLEGAQSLWCGTRPDDASPFICGYVTAPGYGNNWNQSFCSATCLSVTGDVQIHFSFMWDSEPGYDATALQVDECDDQWMEIYGNLGVWDGVGTDTLSIAVADSLHDGALRFRFQFISDGAWSDSDGLWDTDGAFILDELSVTDALGTVVAPEDFEDESVGDTDADDWVSCTMPGYGDFSALYPGSGVVQEDPCASETDCLWAFYNGSTYDYSCGGWPGQTAVPYENARGQYIHNEVWSPLVPITGTGSVYELRFDVYRDLPLNALIFYVWKVRSIVDGCPGGWRWYNFIYYGGGKDWLRSTFGIGQFLEPGASHIQIGLGARDMCLFWGGIYGSCTCHTHAPLFDDVEVYHVASIGPQWQVRDLDLFQDNFSEDGTITGTARADAANDILPSSSPGILPGDSVSVTVSEPENGLGFHVPGDTSSGPAVYCFVSVDGPHAGVTGDPLSDDPRYNVVGTSMITGRTWTQIQMDSSYTKTPSVVADDYNIDLNDNLFVPGDTVWFFFGARNTLGSWTYYSIPHPARTNTTSDIADAAAYPDEFTILPAGGYARGGEILYVDGMNFRGAQPYFDWSFKSMNVYDLVDRYDIRGPSSAVGNHPASRVVDVFQQLIPIYGMIIWNTGNLVTAFGDGTGTPDKSDDTGLLYTWLNNLFYTGGFAYLSGDDVADEWLNTFTGASATQLRTAYMNFNVVTGSHVSTVGVSPLVVGTAGGFFQDAFGPDTLVAFGGCPLINDFDIIDPQGTAVAQMEYHGNGNTANAIVSQWTPNAATPTNTVGFVLSGFSYHYIRDHRPADVPARTEHLWRILELQGVFPDPVGTRPTETAVNSLSQNHPNPFNPVTTIDYSIARAGHVSLKVYNVAGQLVRTLVDEAQSPEQVKPVIWDGRNDAGQSVSSGVYFYKLVAKGFTQTKKLVLLK
jgi:hypothetical protein